MLFMRRNDSNMCCFLTYFFQVFCRIEYYKYTDI